MQLKTIGRGLAAAGALALAAGAQAQANFPSKPITIVVPASPGGAIDIAARLIGARFTAAWGQPVTIENKGGAAGMLGSDFVAKAAPDGHTLALVASSHAINPSMYKKLPFDTVKSFEPVVQTHVVPLMLVVNKDIPARNVTELVSYLKGHPGQVSYASSGNGGAPHMSAELFRSVAGVDIAHVPYKGSTAAHPDLIAGRTALMFDTVAAVAPQVKGDKVRALAVTTPRRSSLFPELPTMAEAGLKGYETSTWGGLLAPAGTPKDVIAKLNAEANKALATPELREKLAAAGIEPAGGTPQQFGDFIQSEIARWAKVAKSAGIQPD
ncbi:tripartite tricarboxylate transporter substrate binding protein [Azohydromonas caseinilytica]|uniref:Tripartite tricarboxylate transporter substrate binding protein n=1 Tax=Azohydromonas caseinilytica TaxID=2728836 RepID=A0A848FDC3_9BURK|nr:tripartite tricarboxylate transporter substrate binding protein [Azohydromonas caseinilytica]NML15931.1 tripartite tricarboxylate transporter substrate binding protein [Azohydromonas caseinilytica]